MPDFYWERPVGVTPRSSMSFMARGTPNDTIQPNCSLCVNPREAVETIESPCLDNIPIPNVATLVFTNPAADDSRNQNEYLSHYSEEVTSYSYFTRTGTLHNDSAVLNIRPNLDFGTGTTEINIPLNNPTYWTPCSGTHSLLQRWYSIKTGWSYDSLANPNSGWVPATTGVIPAFELQEGYTAVHPDYTFVPTYGQWQDPYPEVSGYYRINTGWAMSSPSAGTGVLRLSATWYRDLFNIPDVNTAYDDSRILANGKRWAITKSAFIDTSDTTFRVMGSDGGFTLGISNPATLDTTGSDTFTITADLTINSSGTVTSISTSVTGGTCSSVDARLGL